MLLIGDLESACVYVRIARSQENEEEEERSRDGETPYQRGIDGVGLQVGLERVRDEVQKGISTTIAGSKGFPIVSRILPGRKRVQKGNVVSVVGSAHNE